MAAGSIIIDLLMRTGSFETDTRKAERALNRLKKEAVDTGKVIGAALAAGAITAAYAFDKLVKGAAEFKDLEETTGARAEDLASLAVAAETAGVGMETLAANSIRLSKGLAGVDDETKAAGAAISALGLDLAEFKGLDPVAQIDALTKAFAGFADGTGKTNVATALWGKSGAEMLKLMKALEEQGGRTTILTQTQIEQADAYADAQAKATAELRLYAQAAMTQGIPALSALIEESKRVVAELIGLDQTTGKLGLNTAVRDFAEGGAKWLGFLIDEVRQADADIRAFIASTKQEVKALELVWVSITDPVAFGKDMRGEEGRLSKLRKELAAFTKDAKDAAKAASAVGPSVVGALEKRFADQRTSEQRLGAFSDPRSLTFGAKPRDLNEVDKPRLNFSGAAGKGAKAAKDEIDQVAKAINALEEELAMFGQSDAFEKAFKLEGLGATTAQVDEYRKKLSQLEELKTHVAIEETISALVKERDELGLTNEQLTIQKLLLQGATEEQLRYANGVLETTRVQREQKDAADEGRRIYEQTRTPAEALNIEIARLNALLQKGAVDWDTYSRAVFDAQDKFDAATKKTETQADSFSKRFAENTQDFLGQGLYDAMTGNFKNIGSAFAQMITRMTAEAAAAEISRSLFGDLIKGGEGKGIFSDLIKSGADAGKDSSKGFASQFSDGLKGIGASVRDIFSSLFSSVGDLFKGGGDFLGGLMRSAGSLFGGLFADGGYTGAGRKNEPAGIVHRGEIVWSQRDIRAAGGVDVVEALRQGKAGYPAGGFFADGGYTGTGGKNEPAGIVHRGEVVWSQRDVRAAGGVDVVEALRQGKAGYADGGVVGSERFLPRTVGMTVPTLQGRGGGNTINFGGINVNSNGAMDRAAEDRAAMRIARKAGALMNRRTA